MKTPYVADLRPNEPASGVFLVQRKEVRQKKNGDPYLSMVLADRTGDVDSKMWDNVAGVAETFEQDDFVRVKGMPQVFQNRLQFTVHTLVRVGDGEVDLADYLPASRRDPEEMFTELKQVIASVGNPDLRLLLESVVSDGELARKLKRSPAAKSIHHAWLGGLLEHVLSLCTLCRSVAPLYPNVDQDLLLAGAILHDIGKIEELTCERTFSYSDAGQLLGHILLGLRIVEDKISCLPGFPDGLKTLVLHLVASHHGELEFGAPKVPMTAEALMLHMLDNLDSKMETMRSAVERDRQATGCWTAYVASLERNVLKKDRFLGSQADAKPAPRDVAPGQPAPEQASLFAGKLQEALRKE